MQEQLIEYLREYEGYAVLISILFSTIIAVLGILPSYFITGVNIAFFGFWQGMFVSMAGEVVGATAAFYIYRKGFQKPSVILIEKYPRVKKLIYSEGWEAFWLIIMLRIVPFIPSGFITFASAVGKVSFAVFVTASTLGKIPALFIETLTVYQVMKINWLWEIIIELLVIVLIYNLWKKWKNR